MDRCNRRNACTCTRYGIFGSIRRAARAVFGVIIIGILTNYFIQLVQSYRGTDPYEQLQSELQQLQRQCARRNGRQARIARNDEVILKTPNSFDAMSIEDDLRAMIRKEFEIYASDKTGLPDFAMESLGACVLTVRNTEPYIKSGVVFFKRDSSGDPQQILKPSMSPGSCWAFKGTRGTAVIKLIAFVYISKVTLEHISALMSPTGNVASAPKTFTVWGLQDYKSNDYRHKFGTFVYENNGPPVQTFTVPTPTSKSFRIVEVIFEDNHGNPNYTCVYRVRIHGKMDTGKVIDRALENSK